MSTNDPRPHGSTSGPAPAWPATPAGRTAMIVVAGGSGLSGDAAAPSGA